jgi:uncharacterized Tic20 family protein
MKTARGKAFLDGLFVCLIGLGVYLTPAFVVAFRLANELASQKQGSAAISAQISQTIARLYAENWLPQVGLIVIVVGVLVWRRRTRVARKT